MTKQFGGVLVRYFVECPLTEICGETRVMGFCGERQRYAVHNIMLRVHTINVFYHFSY